MAFADDVVLINETRSKLRPEDIGPFVKRLGEARDYLFEAQGRSIAGALASFYVDPSLVRGVERRGLLILGLGLGRGVMGILNTEGFQPQRF